MPHRSPRLLSAGLWSALTFVLAFAGHARSESLDSQAEPVSSPRLRSLVASLESRDSAAAIKAFWNEIATTGTPLVEPVAGKPGYVLMTFLWQARDTDETLNVSVTGARHESFDRQSDRLVRLSDTNVWYRTYEVESNTRFQYYLRWPQGYNPAPEALERYAGAEGIQYEYFHDPRSTHTVPYALGVASYAEGPDAPLEPWIKERADTSHGKTTTFDVTSTVLGNTREITVHQPAASRSCNKACPFVLIFDRDSYLQTVGIPRLLDNMIAVGVIPPMVAVMVDNVARDIELPANPRFARFIAEELLPSVREKYNLTRDPRQAVIAGSSYGGLAAAFIALTYPNVFGNVLSQSGSYWWHPGVDLSRRDDDFRANAGWLPHQYAVGAKLPLRFYLDVGLWEGADVLAPNRRFRDVLRAKGYEVSYREFMGTHTYLNWRATFPEALMSLVGTAKGRAMLREQEIFER